MTRRTSILKIDKPLQIINNKRSIKKIQQNLSEQLAVTFFENVKIDKLEKAVRTFFVNKFAQTMEYISLESGTLRAEFGLSDKMVSRLPQMLREFCNTRIIVQDKKSILIYVGFQSSDELLQYTQRYPYAYLSRNRKGVSTMVYWLEWLLFYGSEPVVTDYKVKYMDFKNRRTRTRSGLAIMVGKDGSGFSYSVGKLNPHFAGTESDNWFNRTLNENSGEFLKIVSEYLLSMQPSKKKKT